MDGGKSHLRSWKLAHGLGWVRRWQGTGQAMPRAGTTKPLPDVNEWCNLFCVYSLRALVDLSHCTAACQYALIHGDYFVSDRGAECFGKRSSRDSEKRWPLASLHAALCYKLVVKPQTRCQLAGRELMAGADMPLTATTDTLGVLMLIVSLPASSEPTPPR